MEPYFNISRDGQGLEGFVNYANTQVDNLLSIFFIAAMWIIMFNILQIKTIWRTGPIISFTSFVMLIIAAIMKTFTPVHELLLVGLAFGVGIGIVIGIIENG